MGVPDPLGARERGAVRFEAAELDAIENDTSVHPTLIVDGVERFQPSGRLSRWIVDTYRPLNDLWVAHHMGVVPLREIATFYREIGYSVAGYDEVIGVKVDDARAELASRA